jgi:ABC-2 type transport system permease protein
MSLWRLELLRLLRTRRGLALLSVYVLFGFIGPLTARYLNDLLELAGDDLEGATIELPDAVPSDGMAQYVANAMQVGLVVTVVVAAGSLALDATPEMGAFLRTRVRSVWRLLLPRLVVSVVAIALAFTLGALVAWYETWALLGGLPARDVLAGIALGLVFLAYVVAVTAAAAQWTKGVLATVMVSLLSLLVLPVVGAADVIGRWLPSGLATALADLPAGKHDFGHYLGPAAVTLVTTAVLIRVALIGARRREL